MNKDLTNRTKNEFKKPFAQTLKPTSKGFTLIEVIIALMIFAIGVLGILNFFLFSTKSIRVARQTTTASNLAQGIIEEEFSKSYDELTPAVGAKIRFSSDPVNPFYNYQKQINIGLIDSNLSSSLTDIGLKKIDVIIYWQDQTNEKNLQISTIKSKK